MVKNILLLLFVSFCLSAVAQTPKFKLVTTQFSKGLLPNREYIQLIVDGKNTCSETLGGDSIANLSHYVIYDVNGDSIYIKGKDTTPGIASGKYRFPKTRTWDSIPFGSTILIYNNLDKNNSITVFPDSTGKINRGLYVIPVNWLERVDSAIVPPPDSIPTILPTPPSLNLKEGDYAYLTNPVNPPYVNNPANWKKTTVASRAESPGSSNTQAMTDWTATLLTPATKVFSLSFSIFPPPVVRRNGKDTVNPFCPKPIKISARTSLPDSSVVFSWSINSVPDSVFVNGSYTQNFSDSLYQVIHHNDSVRLITSTNLKCITGHVDTIIRLYYASNIYPEPPPLRLYFLDSITKPLVDTCGLDTLGNRDSTIWYKTFCKGSMVQFAPKPNFFGETDTYRWVKNGVTVSTDSLFIDSNINKSKDTLYCILASSLPCVSKPYDTTTIILIGLDSIPIPTVTISGDTAACSNGVDTFRAVFSTDAILNKMDTTARYKLLWYVGGNLTFQDTLTYHDTDGVKKMYTLPNFNLPLGDSTVYAVLMAAKTQSCPYYSGELTIPPDTLTSTSDTLHLHIIQAIQPTISMIATQEGLCKAPFIDSIQFTATTDTLSAGYKPKFNWYLNGALVTDASAIKTTITDNGDTSIYTNNGKLNYDIDSITVQLINTTAKCFLTSDTASYTMVLKTFDPYPPVPTVVMESSVAPPFCANGVPTDVVLSAGGLKNQGSRPIFQWFLNNTKVSDGSAYIYKPIVADDYIQLKLTSSVACADPRDTSAGLRIIIDKPYITSIMIDSTINRKTICQNSIDTLFVSPDDKSLNSPATNFDIYINGTQSSSNMSLPLTISAANLSLGVNSIYVVMHSGVTCLAKPSDTSNAINITLNSSPLVDPISGPGVDPATNTASVCKESSKILYETTPGGVWSATSSLQLNYLGFLNGIDSVKITGLTEGSSTVTYKVTDPVTLCSTSVNLPVTITSSNIPQDSLVYKYRCTFDPLNRDTIYNSASQGFWRSSDNNIATVNPFTFTDINGFQQNAVEIIALNNGEVTIYDSIYTPDCGTTIRSSVLVIGPPIIDSVTGNNPICTIPGGTEQLKVFVRGDTARSWTTSDANIATVDNNGLVTAVAPGSVTITLNAFNTCTQGFSSASKSVQIQVGPPTDPGTIQGANIICVKSSTAPYQNSIPNGVWSSDKKAIATIDSLGVATGVSVGTDSIRYTVSNTCGSISTAVFVTIATEPTKFPITSSDSIVCTTFGNNTLQLSNTVTGGVWSSVSTNLADIDQSGLVTGKTNGIDTIKYTVTQDCGSYTVDTIIIVGAPIEGDYSFKNPICVNDSIKLTNSLRGATDVVWGATQSTVAQVYDIRKGLLTGVAGGTTNVYLLVSNKCTPKPIYIQDTSITVNPLPVIPSIVGKFVLCLKDTTTLTNSSAIKGNWSTNNAAIASITQGGFVTATGAGNAAIGYKVTNATTGCHDSIGIPITIDTLPKVPAIGGANAVCYGRSITLKDSAAIGATGYWESLNPSVAGVTNTGIVLGVAPGTTSIKYLVIDGNSCRDSVSAPLKVNPIPSIGAIGGLVDSICVNNTAQLTNSATGVWTISNSSASITTTGSITGLTVGLDTISYKVTTLGCDTTVTLPIKVTKPFVAPIEVIDSLSVPVGLTIRFDDNTPNGTWSLNPGSLNRVSGSGIVTGGYPGPDTLRYTVVSAGCTASVDTVITILNPLNDIYVPNFFNPYSPNKENHTFMVLGKLMSGVDFKVFSPWGALMYHTNDINAAGWDGKFNGQDMPTGVYVYTARITVKDVTGKVSIINKKGAVNLIR